MTPDPIPLLVCSCTPTMRTRGDRCEGCISDDDFFACPAGRDQDAAIAGEMEAEAALAVGARVALRVDPWITGTVTGFIDTADFGRLPLVSWGDFDSGEPESPGELEVLPPPLPHLTCRTCGRSTADSSRDLAAPILYFRDEKTCLPCAQKQEAP